MPIFQDKLYQLREGGKKCSRHHLWTATNSKCSVGRQYVRNIPNGPVNTSHGSRRWQKEGRERSELLPQLDNQRHVAAQNMRGECSG